MVIPPLDSIFVRSELIKVGISCGLKIISEGRLVSLIKYLRKLKQKFIMLCITQIILHKL